MKYGKGEERGVPHLLAPEFVDADDHVDPNLSQTLNLLDSHAPFVSLLLRLRQRRRRLGECVEEGRVRLEVGVQERTQSRGWGCC